MLRALAGQLEAEQETSLGPARLNGEVARTAFQLRGFADEVERSAPYAVVDDEAIAGAPPQGRPPLVKVRVPLGPVAMFAASNFPFAFSALGGDTASALAALAELGLPAGVIGMVEGGASAVGVHLVRQPLVTAAAFTGSERGGLALQAEAQKRRIVQGQYRSSVNWVPSTRL